VVPLPFTTSILPSRRPSAWHARRHPAANDPRPKLTRHGRHHALALPRRAFVGGIAVAVVDGEPSAEVDADEGDAKESVTHPSKLIRIASMVRTLLDEVRSAPLDDAGRQRMRTIYERSLLELQSVLSEDLQQELAEVVIPFSSESPSESELRIAQAQLVGWLEGLFHGIQATMFTQQAMAQQQLEQMRRRALESGRPVPGMGDRPGAYL
jgi:hypothetical protein